MPNFLVAPAVVAQSDFISTLPERLARRIAESHSLQLLAAPIPLPRFTMSLGWHARVDNDPAHRWLRQVMLELLAAGLIRISVWLQVHTPRARNPLDARK